MNDQPNKIEDLILRYLRLTDHYAFDQNYILQKVKEFADNPEDISFHDIATGCFSLRNRGYIYQLNLEYYSITKEGRNYIEAKHPLFEVIELKTKEKLSNEKQ